jgi:hypothetical protein
LSVAETVVPSVRGLRRIVVASLLVLSAGATGALAGFAVGAVWSGVGLDPLGPFALAGLVAAALVLDLGVPPLSVRRQVPQAWGRIFGPRTVAVLYGARLGVGPLTILRTWLWWAAFIAGASAGPWWSAAASGLFGVERVAAMLAVGTRAGRVQRVERMVVPLFAVAALAAAGSAFVVNRDTPRLAASPSGNPLASPGGAGSTKPNESDASGPPASVADVGLGEALPATVLDGWERVPDDPAHQLGPLDLNAASEAEQDSSAERALLETRQFTRGQARAWRSQASEVAYSSVYEFATNAGAAAYLSDGMTTIEARGARLYEVQDLPGARGFSQADQSSAGSSVSHGVAFVRGARFYLVFVSGRDSRTGADEARAAALAVNRNAAATGH